VTGPEHYRKAEELLGYAEALDAGRRGSAEDMSFLAEAQVHAALANAAAAALNGPHGLPVADQEEWAEAAGWSS
jgi:hypothetical protein